MMKIAGLKNSVRITALIVSLLPLLIIIITGIISGNLLALGYFVAYFSCLIIILVNLFLNFFDWNVFIENDKIVLRRFFSKVVEIDKIDSLKVRPIPILSTWVELYMLKVNEKEYFFKISSEKLFERFFSQNKISEEMGIKISSHLSKTNQRVE